MGFAFRLNTFNEKYRSFINLEIFTFTVNYIKHLQNSPTLGHISNIMNYPNPRRYAMSMGEIPLSC